MQVLAMKAPPNYVRELFVKSLDYYLLNSRNYWQEIIKHESEKKSRLIGRIGRIWWLAPFAPLKRYEVLGVSEDKASILELSNSDITDIANGISRILRFYDDMNILAFNMAIISAPLGGELKKCFRLQTRICARFGFKKPFLSDFWALPTILNTDEIFEEPEEYASKLRKYFSC